MQASSRALSCVAALIVMLGATAVAPVWSQQQVPPTKGDQGQEIILTKGQTFYEAPGQLHAVSANASQTEPAKVIAFIVAESGKPITVPERP